MQLTKLTQSDVEILEVKVGVVRIVVRCDDIAATIIRQQLAKSQLLHTFLKHCVVLLVPKNTAPVNGDPYLYQFSIQPQQTFQFISQKMFMKITTVLGSCTGCGKYFFTFPRALWDNICCTHLCPL